MSSPTTTADRPSRSRLRERADGPWLLALDTVRTHRVSLMAWAIGGAVAMAAQALAIAKEMEDFPGGARALATSIAASAEGMRALRWPAERLDTLGGYLTFHNVLLFNLFLAVYGAVVGAKSLRGAEERHAAEELIAAGVSRRGLLAGRVAGFVLVAALVAAGLSVGTAVGMSAGGEPDLGGSVVTCATTGLVAVLGFALGVLLGQLAPDARAAAGLASLVLVVLYLATNLDGELPGAGALAAVSPFTLANRSRALVPGYGLDLWATLALVLATGAMLALAAVAGERRDHGAPLWGRRGPTTEPAGHVARVMMGSVPTATLRRGAVGLLVWAVSAGAVTAMMGALQPDIIDVWSEMGFLSAFGGEAGAEASYWSFVASLLPAVLAAYVTTQTSTWVNDLHQGRVEMMRSTPVSRTALVTGRLVALLAGSAAISLLALGALAAVAASVGDPLGAAGVGRVGVVSLLFAASLGALSALVSGIFRSSAAVVALALLVGASYLLSYLVPLFGWPDWLNRLSLFWAFGTPYTGWPSTAQLVTLLVVAVGGTVAATVVAERSSSVP